MWVADITHVSFLLEVELWKSLVSELIKLPKYLFSASNDGYLYLLIDRHLVFWKVANQLMQWGNILQSTHNYDGWIQLIVVNSFYLHFISYSYSFCMKYFHQSITKLSQFIKSKIIKSSFLKNHEIMKTGLNQNRGVVFKFEIHQNHKIVKMELNRKSWKSWNSD